MSLLLLSLDDVRDRLRNLTLLMERSSILSQFTNHCNFHTHIYIHIYMWYISHAKHSQHKHNVKGTRKEKYTDFVTYRRGTRGRSRAQPFCGHWEKRVRGEIHIRYQNASLLYRNSSKQWKWVLSGLFANQISLISLMTTYSFIVLQLDYW